MFMNWQNFSASVLATLIYKIFTKRCMDSLYSVSLCYKSSKQVLHAWKCVKFLPYITYILKILFKENVNEMENRN